MSFDRNVILAASQLPPSALDNSMGGEHEALEWALRAAQYEGSDPLLGMLANALRAWFMSNGAVQIERAFRLPTTPDALRKSRRDCWLREAVLYVEAPSSWAAATRLADAWDTFLARGSWREWRDDPAPPGWASPMNRALFYASRFNRGESLGAKHVHRIVGQFFEGKSL